MNVLDSIKKLIKEKKIDEAIDALKKSEQTATIKGLLGCCYFEIGNYDVAQNYLIDSILEQYDKEFAKTLEKLLLAKQNYQALLGLKIMADEKNPNDIFTLREITQYAQKTKSFDIALEYFTRLLKLCPNDYVAWNNKGLIYEEIGKWEEAYDCYKKALSLKDFFSPNFNLGVMSRKMHRFEDSIKYFKKAVTQNPASPQPKYSLAMSYMMLKDFKNGYPLYAKHMTKIMPGFYKNEWDGKKHPDKSLCIFTTGGLGDMIMFSRYFEYLEGYFKEIFVLLPSSLHKIFERTFPNLTIIDSNTIFMAYDYATTPMHILKHFNLDFNVLVPHTDGFLKTDEESTEKFRRKFFSNNKLKIGINWHGNREGTRTFFNRSMTLKEFEPVFEQYREKAVFYSVQKDEAHADLKDYPFIIDLYNEIKDFDDTASIMKNLDLLISIDSSPVHMAGAIGLKTFALLPYANEWRWFVDDNKTIWYDSVELFRQDKEGDWESAVQKVLNKMSSIY